MPRRYGQWAAAVLFVLVAVVAAGWLWQQKSDRVEVLAVTHAVPAGTVLSNEDLKVVDVAGVDGAVGADDASSIIGSAAAVELVPGQILTPEMLTPDPLPGPGERVVGVQLDGTRAPGGLVPGDRVSVLAVPPSGDAGTPADLSSPTVLAEVATVRSVERVQGAGTRFALLVPRASADQVAAFGAAGRVSLVQAPLSGDG
jgi:Flp pilus assembly protein CpaB